MAKEPRPRLRQTFRAFRSRNYRLFYFGQLVSICGSWMQRVAQAWLVLDLTDSPFALGTVVALQFLPVTLLSLFGGVVADRLPKQRLLAATQAVQMAQAAVLGTLAATGLIELWHVYALALLLGLSNALDNPTRQAMMVELVGPDDLPNAIALNSTVHNCGRIVGPSIGGLIIAAAGVPVCFWINAASYLAVIGALLAMRRSELFEQASPIRGRLLGQVKEGLAYALRTRDVCLVVILLAAVSTLGFNFNTVVPLLARYVLETGPVAFGVLFSCLGVGSISSALTIAARREATERALLGGAIAFCTVYLLIALSPWFVTTAALLTVWGMSSTLFSATANARMQLGTPPELRGRVMSIFTLLMMGTTPIGGSVIGGLSEWLGVRAALAICAGVCWLGVVAALVYARRRPVVAVERVEPQTA